MKSFVTNFLSKCEQIRRKLRKTSFFVQCYYKDSESLQKFGICCQNRKRQVHVPCQHWKHEVSKISMFKVKTSNENIDLILEKYLWKSFLLLSIQVLQLTTLTFEIIHLVRSQKFSEKPPCLTPWYTHVHVHIRG